MPMKNSCGIEIEAVEKGSYAEKAGLHPGDCLISINRQKIRDVIDLMFYNDESAPNFLISRNREKMLIKPHLQSGTDDSGCETDSSSLGIALKPFKIKTCKNNCIFCFVSQLPKGMRRPLYVKDEDYRMSFLFGNYITMTNLTDEDKKRIIEQRLSPLYISVHSTDTETRNRIIGNPNAADILKEIKLMADNKIRMHTQIVLCPGHNDGKNLQKTISDLYKFYPYVMSIAVVPVGLTSHRKKKMLPVTAKDAINALEIIHKFQARYKRKHGEQIVYAADELYIKAQKEFPSLNDYGDLPQIENGVGLAPLFIHQAKKIKNHQLQDIALKPTTLDKDHVLKKKFITFTGISFYPYLLKFIEKMKKNGIDIEVIPVKNTFFGETVTVTGLITGRDVMKTLSGTLQKDDILLIPDIVMRENDDVFLDDVSRTDVEDVLGIRAVVIESTPKGIVEAVSALS